MGDDEHDEYMSLGWIMWGILLGGCIVNGLNFKFVTWAYTGLYKEGYIG